MCSAHSPRYSTRCWSESMTVLIDAPRIAAPSVPACYCSAMIASNSASGSRCPAPVDVDDHAVQRPGEPERRGVAVADRRALLPAARQAAAGDRVAHRRRRRDLALADDGAVDEQPPGPAEVAVAREREPQLVVRRARRSTSDVDRVPLLAEAVVHVAQAAVEQVERPAAEHACPSRAARPRRSPPSGISTSRGDRVVAVAHVHGDVLGDRRAVRARRRTGRRSLERPARREQRGDRPVVERQHLVLARLLPPELDHLRELAPGSCGGEVVALREVLGDVVQLPHVVLERRVGVDAVVVHRAERLERHRLPAVVVDAAAAEHLEVLRGVALRGASPAREHGDEARALDRALRRRRRSRPAASTPMSSRIVGSDVDRVRELVADLAAAGDAARPVHDARDRRRRPRAPRASSAGTACCRPSSSPTGSCCARSACRARRCARAAPGGPPGLPFQSRGVVDRAALAALGARAVVGDEHDERVVALAELVDEREQPARSARRRARGSRRSTP